MTVTSKQHFAARLNLKKVRRAAIVFALAFVLLQIVRSSLLDWIEVPSNSMEPTIRPGSHLLVDQAAFGLRFPFTRWTLYQRPGPNLGDIVVFISPRDHQRLIKRVAALPGDTLQRRGGYLARNGIPTTHPASPAQPDNFTLTLPPDTYYLLGDNAEASLDSRTFGPVPRDAILGRAR